MFELYRVENYQCDPRPDIVGKDWNTFWAECKKANPVVDMEIRHNGVVVGTYDSKEGEWYLRLMLFLDGLLGLDV